MKWVRFPSSLPQIAYIRSKGGEEDVLEYFRLLLLSVDVVITETRSFTAKIFELSGSSAQWSVSVRTRVRISPVRVVEWVDTLDKNSL